MAIIVSLCGREKTGKTTVLNNVIDSFGPKSFWDVYYEHGSDRVVMGRINGVWVGITTRGDNKKVLIDDFGDMVVKDSQGKETRCEVYVCASRTSGETQTFLSKREKEQKDSVVFFHTWKEYDKPEQKKQNEKKQNEMMDAINHFCK